LKKGKRQGGRGVRGLGAERMRVKMVWRQKKKRERERSHQLRFARSIKLLDLEMFSGGAHFLRLRVVNGA